MKTLELKNTKTTLEMEVGENLLPEVMLYRILQKHNLVDYGFTKTGKLRTNKGLMKFYINGKIWYC